jgi:hypothetical protein
MQTVTILLEDGTAFSGVVTVWNQSSLVNVSPMTLERTVSFRWNLQVEHVQKIEPPTILLTPQTSAALSSFGAVGKRKLSND